MRAMDSIPSKRRKLDHDSSDGGEALSDDNDSSVSISERNLPHEVKPAVTKPAPSRPSLISGAAESALYADGTYNSSIFKLQVDEMLAELRLKESRRSAIDGLLRQLKQLIEGIESREPLSVCFTTSPYPICVLMSE